MIDLNQFMRRTQADKLYVKKDEVDGLQGIMQSVTLYASNWVDNTQTVAVEGATADNNIMIGASGDPMAFANAGVYCSAQADGYLTFNCTTTPTEDIVASVFIMG